MEKSDEEKKERKKAEKISLLFMDVIIAGNYTSSNILGGNFSALFSSLFLLSR